MGTNSIKANLTKDSIISDIKLLLGADINKENIYVVVEGDDDIKFLRRYLNSNVTIFSGIGVLGLTILTVYLKRRKQK